MIEELRVHGTGGIRDAELVFDGSFIVITGESGSGKSSLVRAMEFITGKRAQVSNIHALEDASDVSLVISAQKIDGLEDECQPQEGTLIARRLFTRSGRGRCTLQNRPVPLSVLAAAMENEVVIQSQFAQLGLLDPAKQLELVDSCGGTALSDTRGELERVFGEAIALERAVVALKKRRSEMEERFQNSDFVLRQIKALQLTPDSETAWEKELKELDVRAAKTAAILEIFERFTGGAAGCGLLSQLEDSCKAVYGAISGDGSVWREKCERMLASAQELTAMLRSEAGTSDGRESIEEAQEKLEKKLGLARKLKRALGLPSCAHVLEYAAEAERETAWLRTSREELEKMESDASRKKKEITSFAIELRRLRRESAHHLSARVNSHLNDLAMEYATFEIQIEELDKVRANGAENAVFTLSLPDQSPMPVGKTASGGELSRILIALQLSLGDDKLPGTLIFDEVEAGLGGRTALLAGYKLRALSGRCRTILITHEATIAAMADRHFLVRRNGDETHIFEITGEAREREIARMLAGDENSKEAIDHARSLLAGNSSC